jgi:hypothetical protein
MHPAFTASLRVASSTLAVTKMTGHLDPDAASRRCSSIPEIPPRWMSSSRQVAVCAVPLSINDSAEANVRVSMPLCAQQPRHALQKARIVIDHDYDYLARCHIRVQSRRGMRPRCDRPLIWIKEIQCAVDSQAAFERRPY